MLQTSAQTTSEARPALTAELVPIAKSNLEACCPECADGEPCC